MSRIQLSKVPFALLALALCTGTAQATTTLVANPTALTLSCDTNLGPTAGTVGITLAAASSALNVTVSSSSGAVVLPSPALKSVSSTSVATNYSFTMASGCAGATNGQVVTLTFTPASGTALTVNATLTVTTSATLVANPTSLTLSCDTLLGPTAGIVGITLANAGSAVNVTAAASPSGVVTLPSPATQSVGSTTTAVNYSFTLGAGCKGATNGQVITLTFTPSTGSALTVSATLAVTNSGSALAPSPSAVTITCTKGAGYTPGPSQTVNVTSGAPGGTPFTVDNTTNVLPSWLSVTSLAGGTASSTAVALTVVAKSGCGGLSVGSTTFTVHLLAPPASDRLLPVTIQIGAAATLAASPTSVSLSYTKGSFSYTGASTTVSASPAVYFTVNPATLPIWLSASPASGTTTSGVSVTFTPTAGAETLALGTYTANVHLVVSGDLDAVVPVTLQVKNPAATLSVSDGTTRTLSWTLGTALPSLVITPISSDSPIAYAVTTTANTLSPQVSATSGIAYSFGSPITVTFLQSVFGAAAPGAALSGSVIFTPNSGSPVTVSITVNVRAPGATVSAISPAALPTASSGSFTVGLSGSGFVASGGASVVTNVGIVAGGIIVPDANITPTITNSTSIVLSIAVPSNADPLLPFSGTGGTVTIGVCNPQGTSCNAPTSTIVFTIGINPIVQTVTSASSYIQATAPTLTTISPYDILSVFGTNFCISGGTGCTGGSSVLYGSTDPVSLRYLTSLSPDASGSTQRNLSVIFQTHASSPTAIATAPMMFATNNQINVVVPDAVKAYIGNTVDIVVSFGYGSGSSMLKSLPYSVTVAATNPGIFTVGGDGQGDAAALSPTYSLVTSSSPANSRTGSSSDIVQLYVTGLGVPDSVNSSTAWPGITCMALSDYWTAINTGTAVSPALTTDDGLVLQSSFMPTGQIQPCIKSNSADVPTVTIGGVSAAVKYAGWVSGSIAGLYQINVQIPVSSSSFTDVNGVSGAPTTSAVHLPVVVTANSRSSQPAGVAMWVVQGGLVMTSSGATSGAANSAWAGSAVSATGGTGPYTYTVSSGTLPAGLTLNNDGTITGTPTATGSATVAFLATDSTSGTALTGTVSITFTIN